MYAKGFCIKNNVSIKHRAPLPFLVLSEELA